MINGEEAQKTGSKKMPSPLHTVALAVRLLFFSEKALYAVFLNNSHTFNIVCFYIITLFIPYRDIDGMIYPDSSGRILESLVLTSVFIMILFLYLPKKISVFMGFLRLMLAFEATSMFLPVSFLLKGDYIKFYNPLIMGWYLSLAIFAVSKIKGYTYWISAVIVFGSFIMTIFIPAFF